MPSREKRWWIVTLDGETSGPYTGLASVRRTLGIPIRKVGSERYISRTLVDGRIREIHIVTKSSAGKNGFAIQGTFRDVKE